MGDGDHDDLVLANAVDDLVRKTGHEQTTRFVIDGYGAPSFGGQRQPFNRPGDLVEELATETTTSGWPRGDGAQSRIIGVP